MTKHVYCAFHLAQSCPSWTQDITIKQEDIISASTEINTRPFTNHGVDGYNDFALSTLADLALGKVMTTMGEIECQKYEKCPGQEGREITLKGQGWAARWRLGPDNELIHYAEGPSLGLLSTKWNEYEMGSQKDYDCAMENARKLARALLEPDHTPGQLRRCPGH